MIKNRNFIVTSLQHWDLEIGFNAKDISLELSKNNQVLFVNTPLDMITRMKGEDNASFVTRQAVLNRQLAPLRQIQENLFVLDMPFALLPANRFKSPFVFDLINKLNNRRMFAYVTELMRKLSFTDVIHLNDNDLFRSFYAKEYLSPSLEIYYRRDNLLSVDYWRCHGERIEPRLVAKSDLVVTNSIQLAQAVQPYNKNTYDIGQGVDLSDFDIAQTFDVPEDLRNIPHPIVGYAGFITDLRLDADLLLHVARALPSVSLVMVGPEDDVFAHHELHNQSNVYFVGNKSIKEIPAYIASFDICINPQILNDATRGNYPRKIDEYLALGKPVVATETPLMKTFESYVKLCSSAQEYVDAIEVILASESVANDGRVAFAHSHSWENSVKKLYECIESQLSK